MNPINKEIVEVGVDATERVSRSYQKFPWGTFLTVNLIVSIAFGGFGFWAGNSGKDESDKKLSEALDFQRKMLAKEYNIKLEEETKEIVYKNDSLTQKVDTLENFVIGVAKQVNAMKNPANNIINKTNKR